MEIYNERNTQRYFVVENGEWFEFGFFTHNWTPIEQPDIDLAEVAETDTMYDPIRSSYISNKILKSL